MSTLVWSLKQSTCKSIPLVFSGNRADKFDDPDISNGVISVGVVLDVTEINKGDGGCGYGMADKEPSAFSSLGLFKWFAAQPNV